MADDRRFDLEDILLRPGFYLNPTSVGEVIDFVAGKLLDLCGVSHALETRWDPKNIRPPAQGAAAGAAGAGKTDVV